MAKLFRAMLPNLEPEFIKQSLSDAKPLIIASDPGQASTGDTTKAKSQLRSTFLGELGHHLESISQGGSHGFVMHRVGEKRLECLQDVLELPCWDMIVHIFEVTSKSKRASGTGQTTMENAVAGCKEAPSAP